MSRSLGGECCFQAGSSCPRVGGGADRRSRGQVFSDRVSRRAGISSGCGLPRLADRSARPTRRPSFFGRPARSGATPRLSLPPVHPRLPECALLSFVPRHEGSAQRRGWASSLKRRPGGRASRDLGGVPRPTEGGVRPASRAVASWPVAVRHPGPASRLGNRIPPLSPPVPARAWSCGAPHPGRGAALGSDAHAAFEPPPGSGPHPGSDRVLRGERLAQDNGAEEI